MSKMKFGLNTSLKKSKPPSSIPKAFFGGDDDADDLKPGEQETKDSHKNRINKQLTSYTSMTNKKIEEQHKQALEEDPNIFDYDAVYDDLKTAEKQKQEQLKGKDNKKARYVEGLIEMAEIRKRDRLRAEEKKVEREREEEGDEFGDKETFVTSSYKAQKEELRRLEAEERRKEEEDSKKKSITSFYRQMLDKREEAHAAVVEASIKGIASKVEVRDPEEDQDTDLVEEARKEGKDVVLNDDNVIVDKRQLLGAGLNVARPKFGSFMSLSSSDPQTKERQEEYEEYKRKKLAESAAKRTGKSGQTERERMSQEVERQMVERQERERGVQEEAGKANF
ncbi:hypothetical protein K450DRAFT_235004 [Umbelopsis ramanniana AG]|uniref:Nuclear speckle splicing regulatory protein 1 N-terminal domain-containing protein n=1 Tax=Umbelopsis ramanniana AG TaxID=1314678 RepID=A0AAD5ECW5_UMBRA|nr:uncharacterized protein K450DRAFT_235004 [Umbelopsis ramanniana AG]KAI8580879.1 hypothetical protein K450DRAFT_235004 [Umbelopsis ramanniana AG]